MDMVRAIFEGHGVDTGELLVFWASILLVGVTGWTAIIEMRKMSHDDHMFELMMLKEEHRHDEAEQDNNG